MNRITKLALLGTALGYTAWQLRPAAREARRNLTESQRNLQQAVTGYDRNMVDSVKALYFGNTGFYNFGYWPDGVEDQGEASTRLVQKLLDWIPEKTGKVLDVACGMGASTRMLVQDYGAGNVTAVNFSNAQLQLAAQRAPGASFAQMDAAHLGFPNASFDAVFCVESAFHFDTRDDFFREAFRVLKPGGHLVMTDILGRVAYPVRENHLRGTTDYMLRLGQAGFESVRVEDATRESWIGFARHALPWPWQALRKGLITPKQAAAFAAYTAGFVTATGAYLHVYTHSYARKPLTAPKA